VLQPYVPIGGGKMGRRRGLWAKQEQRNREMLAQCEAGVPLAEIGAEHGVSAERVRQIVRCLGVPGTGPSAWSPTDTATLRRLWRKGLTASLIADQLGVTKDAITSRANRLDLPSRRPTNQEQQLSG
jgi:DNA-binding CsgD family transcriptional regulator